MLRWFYVLAHLIVEAGAARRDARIRFLKAQVEILRRKLGGNRVIPSPDDASSFCEAWIGALKRETLDYFLCFSLQRLEYIVQQFVAFHNNFRPHQGLGNRTLPAAAAGPPEDLAVDHAPQIGRVHCQRFLGGLLRHYYQDAA